MCDRVDRRLPRDPTDLPDDDPPPVIIRLSLLHDQESQSHKGGWYNRQGEEGENEEYHPPAHNNNIKVLGNGIVGKIEGVFNIRDSIYALLTQ